MKKKISHELEQRESENKREIAEKENVIKKLEEEYAALCCQLQAIEKNRKIQLLEEENVIAVFKKAIEMQDRKYITNEAWKKLRITVEDYYPNFYGIMNGRVKLKEKEYRTCILIKVGITKPSDLEFLVPWEYNYVGKIRSRLNEKVFGEKGKASEFDQKVHSIE